MRTRHAATLLALAVSLTAPAQTPEPDWAAIAGAYPALGTPDADGERGALVWLHTSRTGSDVARAWSEVTPTPNCFFEVTGAGVSAAARPLTYALMQDAEREVVPIVQALKDRFARPRPYATYPGLDPALPPIPNPSFPSQHAVLGTLFAQILVQFRPDRAEAIRDRGRQLGSDRVMVGLHYPSDVEAGQRLGKAFAAWWIAKPENRQRIIQACGAEWH